MQGVDLYHTFPDHSGITRSLNKGFEMVLHCHSQPSDVVIMGNSDTIFGPHSVAEMVRVLDGGADLVGPLSNRPGWGTRAQIHECQDVTEIGKVCEDLQRRHYMAHELPALRLSFDHQQRVGAAMILPEVLNGFTMAATLDTWERGSYNDTCVFNPSYKHLENEMELQLRWALLGYTSAVAARSFVYHYKGEK